MNTQGFSRCDDDDNDNEAAPLEFLCGNRLDDVRFFCFFCDDNDDIVLK